MTSFRTYAHLITIPTFEDRFEYLQLNGEVGKDTFGFDRYINQKFYQSQEWKRVRDYVIIRDNGCDLGIEDRPIGNRILIHHMNPINSEDIKNVTEFLIDPNYLICVSHMTHNAIHYGDENLLIKDHKERTQNDTCPWRQ